MDRCGEDCDRHPDGRSRRDARGAGRVEGLGPAPDGRRAADGTAGRRAAPPARVRPAAAGRHRGAAAGRRDARAVAPVRADPRAGLRVQHRRAVPVPGQRVCPARLVLGRVPGDPARHQAPGGAGGTGRGGPVRPAAPRSGPGDRTHRIGQDHHPRRTRGPRQPHPSRAHRDHRGPHRVPPRTPVQPGEPAGGRRRHRVVPDRAQARPAPGPGHHPGRRAARPGDDRDGADGGGDRTPGPGDAAHAERGADDRPDRGYFPSHQQHQIRAQLSALRSR